MSETSTTKMGYHAGLGGELGLTSLQEGLKLSHEGSMWTTGVTVYF
jgi:hypothetical protein